LAVTCLYTQLPKQSNQPTNDTNDTKNITLPLNLYNTVQPSIQVKGYPTPEQYNVLRAQYAEKFGTDNTYDHRDVWDAMVDNASFKKTYHNMSAAQVSAFIEPMCIANPEVNYNLTWEPGSCICNVTWNCQMQYYPEYEVYTAEGFKLKVEALKAYHAHLIKIGNWSKQYAFADYYDEVMANQGNLAAFEKAFERSYIVNNVA